MNTELISRLREFMENEMRSCSMDISGITPLYVYRMWGGQVPLDEIETAMRLMVNGERLMVLGGKLQFRCEYIQ